MRLLLVELLFCEFIKLTYQFQFFYCFIFSDPLGFSMQIIMLSAHSDGFISSFIICMYFYFFFLPNFTSQLIQSMLNESLKSRNCFVLDLKVKTFSISSDIQVTLDAVSLFVLEALYQVQIIAFYSQLLSFFHVLLMVVFFNIMNEFWTLSIKIVI